MNEIVFVKASFNEIILTDLICCILGLSSWVAVSSKPSSTSSTLQHTNTQHWHKLCVKISIANVEFHISFKIKIHHD